MSARVVIGLLAALGTGLMTFGYRGLQTVAGGKAFDEMDGMIPFGAGVLGVALLIVATVTAVISFWRRRPG
jgi:hypothetical protein